MRKVEALAGHGPAALGLRAAVRLRPGGDAHRAPRGPLVRARRLRRARARRSSDAGEGELRDGAVSGELALAPGESALLSLAGAAREPARDPGPRATRSGGSSDEALLAGVGGRGSATRAPWPEAVTRSALALKLLDVRAVGSDRRRADDLAARVDRRRPQLGLPLHVAARRELDARRDAAARLPRGGARLLLVADARLAPDPAAAADPLPHRRLGPHPGARARPARGLPRLAAGAGRQRRRATRCSSTSTAPCSRRSGSTRGRSGRLDGDTGKEVGADRRLRGRALARQGQRHLGGARRARRTTSSRRRSAGSRSTEPASSPSDGLIPDRSDALARGGRRGEGAGSTSTAGTSELQSYVRAPDMRELDASLLTLAVLGYDERAARRHDRGGRARAARGAVRLPLPRRRRARGEEGAFLTCSFWLVDALRADGPARRRQRADGGAGRARQRRRALLGGDRPAHRRVPRQLPAGPDAPRTDQRGGLDRRRRSRAARSAPRESRSGARSPAARSARSC